MKCPRISKWGNEVREEWRCRWQVKFVLRTCIAVVLKSVRFKNVLLSTGNQLSACQKEYQKNLRRQSASRYVPRCAADGNYGKVQCMGGLCYCVTPRGEQIPGTKTFNSAREPNCSHPGILKPIKQSGKKAVCCNCFFSFNGFNESNCCQFFTFWLKTKQHWFSRSVYERCKKT